MKPSDNTTPHIACEYDKNVKHLKRFNKAYFPITISEHLDLLKQCGFSVAELFWYSYMQACHYEEGF